MAELWLITSGPAAFPPGNGAQAAAASPSRKIVPHYPTTALRARVDGGELPPVAFLTGANGRIVADHVGLDPGALHFQHQAKGIFASLALAAARRLGSRC